MLKLLAMVLLGWVAASDTASAQTTTPPAPRWNAEFTIGPTFSHQANVAFGVEASTRPTDRLQLFLELGRMRNIETTEAANGAALIGEYVSSTSGESAQVAGAEAATYVDAGVRYMLLPGRRWTPYAIAGFGAAAVRRNLSLTINGVEASGQLGSYTVQIGDDLSGSSRGPLVTLGGGSRVAVTGRWFSDVSYRFGRILADKRIDAHRLQFGIGVRF